MGKFKLILLIHSKIFDKRLQNHTFLQPPCIHFKKDRTKLMSHDEYSISILYDLTVTFGHAQIADTLPRIDNTQHHVLTSIFTVRSESCHEGGQTLQVPSGTFRALIKTAS